MYLPTRVPWPILPGERQAPPTRPSASCLLGASWFLPLWLRLPRQAHPSPAANQWAPPPWDAPPTAPAAIFLPPPPQDCDTGYTRTPSGLYLGTCERCSCHGHTEICEPETGACQVSPALLPTYPGDPWPQGLSLSPCSASPGLPAPHGGPSVRAVPTRILWGCPAGNATGLPAVPLLWSPRWWPVRPVPACTCPFLKCPLPPSGLPSSQALLRGSG